MRKIALDYFRRWGWLFTLSGVFQFVIGLGAPESVRWVSMLLTIQTGAILLSFDLARGAARVLRSLPVTREDLARTWRLLAIVAPFLVFAGTLAASNTLKAAIGFGTVLPLSQTAFWMMFAFIWLGMSFHLLTHSSSPGEIQADRRPAKARIVGSLWGISFGGSILFLMRMPGNWQELQPWHWGLMALAAVSAYLGWGRAESMADERTRPANTGNPEGTLAEAKTAPPATQSGGFGFLFRAAALNGIRSTGMLIFFFLGVQILLNKAGSETWREAAERIVREPTSAFLLFPMAMLAGLQWLSSMRHFRTLPMSGSKLTLLIGAIFVLPLLLMLGAMASLQTVLGANFSAEQASRYLLIMAPTLITPALLLYLGLSRRSYFLALAPTFMLIPLANISVRFIPIQVLGLMTVAALIGGLVLVNRAITRRSQTYRSAMI